MENENGTNSVGLIAPTSRPIKPVKQWQRKQYAGMVNKYTGEVAVIDLFEKRKNLMRKRILAWAETMADFRVDQQTRMVMIGLSYAQDNMYEAGHIRLFLKDMKRRLGNRLYGFAWVAELTERGRVHYHLVLLVKKGSHIPKPDTPDKENKLPMWKYGSSSICSARSPFYLIKYVGKEHQKDLSRYPKRCRLYGVSVRLPDVKYTKIYRRRAGLENDQTLLKRAEAWVRKSEGWDKKPESDWVHIATAHNEGYLREIVITKEVILDVTKPYPEKYDEYIPNKRGKRND